MSNPNLIARMHELLQGFENGSLSPYQIEKDFDTCMNGLERIRSEELHTARRLLGRLVNAHFWEGETEFGSHEDLSTALKEFRHFLESLPK